MRAVSWGEVLWDLFPDAERLGGAPANVAYHLAALGRPVALVSRVGDDDAGRRAVSALAAAGVEVSAVQVDGDGRPTGAVEVALENGEARYRLRAGCAWEHIQFDGAAAAAVAGARAICFGTLSQRQAAARAALEQALAAREPGCLAVCDLNLRPGEQDRDLVRWALGAAELVKLNEREERQLAALFGVGDVVSWLLGDLGMLEVALTRGPAGCSLLTQTGQKFDQAGFPATAGGDTVGCGDAFTAVWIDRLLAGTPRDAALESACRYAAYVAGQPGATPPIPAELVRTLATGRP